MTDFVALVARLAEIERRLNGMMRHGTVEEVDPKKGLMRLKMGEDKNGKPFLSPWIPYSQYAGALKVHSAPSKGQQMTVISPTGDLRQAISVPMTWSKDNPSPSGSGDDRVITQGETSIKMNGHEVEIKVGGSSIHINGNGIELKKGGSSLTIVGAGNTFTNGLDIEGGAVTHDGRNIGKTHGHISAPPGPPGPPI